MNVLALALITLTLLSSVQASAIYNLQPDGSAIVIVKVESLNTLTVTLEVKGAVPEEVLAFNQDGDPLPVDLNNSILTVYTMNSTVSTIVYTVKLAEEDGILWRVQVDTNIPTVIVLPEGSGISSFSSGGSVEVVDGKLAVRFQDPGVHTVEYLYAPEEAVTIAPTLTSTPTTATSPATHAQPTLPWAGPETLVEILIAVLVASAAVAYYVFRRRRKTEVEPVVSDRILDERDRAILNALDRYGQMTLADLSKAAGLHKSTVWRRVRKLRELGLVEVRTVSGRTLIERKTVS